MAIINFISPVAERLLGPALELLPQCVQLRQCPELSDAQWIYLGVGRCLMAQSTGRGFLQCLASLSPDQCPELSHFFSTLKSERRLKLLGEVNDRLCEQGHQRLPDALAVFPCLQDFDLHAGDGHFHAHAAHDQGGAEGQKYAVGHLYTRNLRSGLVSHLCVGDQFERKKEHDMRALKRQTIAALRQRAPKGRKVLYVWDRAGIDFKQWYDWKQGSGIYMLSRSKENMVFTKCGDLAFDRNDPINAGVLADELASPSSSGYALRRVSFHDVLSGETFEYLTNLMDTQVPPGVIAWLYKARWNLEKSFDEIKNKLGEQKAWASSPTAKTMQAQFIALSLNLLTLLSHQLEQEHNIRNRPEDNRRSKRLKLAAAQASASGDTLPSTLTLLSQSTQNSVKFIRWVATQMWISNLWCVACATLAALYLRS